MVFIHKLILKLDTVFKNLVAQSYLEMCKKRGLKVGKNVIFIEVPDFGSEPYLVEIGDGTEITAGCRFITHDGGYYVLQNIEKYKDVRSFARIKVGSNCFLGNNCVIMHGVEIGDNCVIGAGSVVTTSTKPNSVYAGVPAKYICSLDEYGEKALNTSTKYPRNLEQNRAELDNYLKKNIPQTYRPIK